MKSTTINLWTGLQPGFHRMHRTKRLRVSEVNPHLICVLCGGYYIDATTITECLHTFCKTCIVGYLEASKHCPVCDNLVHKTKPHLRLRSDHTLQDLVYKLVPGLFQDEMRKRREFYKEEIESGKLGGDGIPEERERIIYSAEEQISLILELSPDGTPPFNPGHRSSKHRLEAADRRYLQCPANISIRHLKKFIKMKFNLCDRFQIDFYHTDETLRDAYTLVDIAYIYSWRRKAPLRLYYSVFTNPAKRLKIEETEYVPKETDTTLNNSDLKTETSGYVSDDDKVNNEMDTSTDSINAHGSGSDSFTEIDTSDPEFILECSDKVSQNNEKSCNPNESKGDVQTAKGDTNKLDVNDKSTPVLNVTKSKNEVTVPDENKLEQEIISTCDVLNRNTKSDKDNDLKQSNLPITDTSGDNHKTNANEANVYDTTAKKEQDVAIKTDTINNVQLQKETDNAKPEQTNAGDTMSTKSNTRVTSKPSTAESSTSTSTMSIKDTNVIRSDVTEHSKSTIKDDDVSEPVVSSTQNTQGCQTEPPESSADMLELPHSSDIDTSNIESHSHKSTVDVSCETDNITFARQISKESVSVSVSTETDAEDRTEKRKSVDCSTDVFDLPKLEPQKKKTVTVDCSTDFDEFPNDSSKRKSLTVDCSTDMDDIEMTSNKRKSEDSSIMTENKGIKKTDSKAPKRSYSYGGHLSTKAAYLAQPLSPTKLTLKFSPPKSPGKVTPKSPSRAEPSGFQSQYQSFVMEMPDKTYDFDDDTPKIIEPPPMPAKSNDSYYKHHTYSSISQSYAGIAKKTQSKTGRPRGRPPKNRSLDSIAPPKEKKHKSRSHSPKYSKHGDKNSDSYKFKHLDNSAIDKRNKSAQSSGDNQRHSTPTTPYSWINKLDSTSSKHSSEQKKQKSKSESSYEKPNQDLKIPKQFLYFSNGQYTIASASSINSLKQSSPLSPTRTVSASETQISSYSDKNAKGDKHGNKKGGKLEKQENERTDIKNINKVENVNKGKITSSIRDEHWLNASSHKTDSNQNKIVTSSTNTTVLKATSITDVADKKHTPASTTVPFPEYRHRSPYFASISGAKLGTTHRPSTHLNIPNLNSHFSGTHHIYAQGRYSSSDRLGTPIYRSLSLNDKNSTASMNSNLQDGHRTDAVSSPCTTFLTFPPPFLGLMPSHMVPSLATSASPKGYSPDSTKSPSQRVSASPTSVSNSAAHNNSKNAVVKTNNSNRKGKEKSIDNIISAITEMRTKKETNTQEQLNGIDLSTKGSRQLLDKPSCAVKVDENVDRFAFTDDDDLKVASQKLQFKTENSPNKSAV